MAAARVESEGDVVQQQEVKNLKRQLNQLVLTEIPKGVLHKITSVLDDATLFAFASTCKTMKNIQEEVKPNWRETIELKRYLTLSHEIGKYDVSDAWIEWVYRVMEEHNQSMEERSELVLLACLHGSLSGLKWLKSKECIVDWKAWEYTGYSGHLKVFDIA